MPDDRPACHADPIGDAIRADERRRVFEVLKVHAWLESGTIVGRGRCSCAAGTWQPPFTRGDYLAHLRALVEAQP